MLRPLLIFPPFFALLIASGLFRGSFFFVCLANVSRSTSAPLFRPFSSRCFFYSTYTGQVVPPPFPQPALKISYIYIFFFGILKIVSKPPQKAPLGFSRGEGPFFIANFSEQPRTLKMRGHRSSHC